MKNFLILLLVLAFSLSYAACQSDDENNELCVENEQEDCICYHLYDPVCGCNDVTYSNDCVAICHGITDFTPGACE